MLPPGQGASEARAAQKSALAGVVHEAATSEGLGALLSRLRAAPAALDQWALANVREASRDFARASAVPKELAQRKAALESSAYVSWLDARSKSDFSIFAPALKEWIEICREVASAIDPEAHVYDVLLGEFEGEERETFKGVFFFLYKTALKTHSLFLFLFPPPKKNESIPVGATEERVLEVFHCVKAGVVPLRKEILEKGKKISSAAFRFGGLTDFDPEIQAKLCEKIALDMGFDLQKGRLDVRPLLGLCLFPGQGTGGGEEERNKALSSPTPCPSLTKKNGGEKRTPGFRPSLHGWGLPLGRAHDDEVQGRGPARRRHGDDARDGTRPLRAAAPRARRGAARLLGEVAGRAREPVTVLGAARRADARLLRVPLRRDQRALSFVFFSPLPRGARGAIRGAQRRQGPLVREGRGR